MNALLRGEILKLRTTRTFLALVGAALALSLLLVTLSATLDSGFSESDVRALFSSTFDGAFICLLGAIGMSGEWRHRTIAGTVLAAPDRGRLIAAKAISYAVAGVLLSLVVTAATIGVGTLILAGSGELTLGFVELADVVWRNLVVAALLGAFGVGLGGLVRNQVVAVTGLLVVALALEPAVIAAAPEVGRYAPLTGAPGGIVEYSVEGLLATGPALAVSIAWVTCALVSAAALLRRRDLV